MFNLKGILTLHNFPNWNEIQLCWKFHIYDICIGHKSIIKFLQLTLDLAKTLLFLGMNLWSNQLISKINFLCDILYAKCLLEMIYMKCMLHCTREEHVQNRSKTWKKKVWPKFKLRRELLFRGTGLYPMSYCCAIAILKIFVRDEESSFIAFQIRKNGNIIIYIKYITETLYSQCIDFLLFLIFNIWHLALFS